jgi:hypothetical protein
MSTNNKHSTASRARYYADPDATAHDLLNNVAELLQYARGLTELLAEFVHESDTVDCRRMALSLDAVAALTQMGAHCAAEAHARLSWEKSSVPADALGPH